MNPILCLVVLAGRPSELNEARGIRSSQGDAHTSSFDVAYQHSAVRVGLELVYVVLPLALRRAPVNNYRIEFAKLALELIHRELMRGEYDQLVLVLQVVADPLYG